MFLRRTGPNSFFRRKRQRQNAAAFGSGFVRGEESKDSNQKVNTLGNPSVQNSEEAGKVGICFCAPPRQEGKQKRGENSKVPEKCQREGIGGSFILRTCEDAKSNPKQKKTATRFCHCPGGIKFRRGDLNARGRRRRRALPGYPPPQLFSILARFPSLLHGSVSQKIRRIQQSPTHTDFLKRGASSRSAFSITTHVGRRAFAPSKST